MYRINALGGGAGYKVQVADTAGGLRVVGVFSNEADARAWIADARRYAAPNLSLAPRT